MAKASSKLLKQLAEEALKNDAVAKLGLYLNKAIIEGNKSTRKERQAYSPSSMACKRMMFYKMIGEKKDPDIIDVVLVGIQEMGSDRHDRIQKYFESMKELGLPCEYTDIETYIKEKCIKGLEILGKVGMETKLFHPELNLSFMTDGIIKMEEEYYIIEIKTETTHKFTYRKGVDPKHHNQAIAYATVFGLDKVLFIYENRDIPEKKIFEFSVTEQMKKKFIALLQEVDEDVRAMEIPHKAEDSKACTYCKYKGECAKDGD